MKESMQHRVLHNRLYQFRELFLHRSLGLESMESSNNAILRIIYPTSVKKPYIVSMVGRNSKSYMTYR